MYLKLNYSISFLFVIIIMGSCSKEPDIVEVEPQVFVTVNPTDTVESDQPVFVEHYPNEGHAYKGGNYEIDGYNLDGMSVKINGVLHTDTTNWKNSITYLSFKIPEDLPGNEFELSLIRNGFTWIFNVPVNDNATNVVFRMSTETFDNNTISKVPFIPRVWDNASISLDPVSEFESFPCNLVTEGDVDEQTYGYGDGNCFCESTDLGATWSCDFSFSYYFNSTFVEFVFPNLDESLVGSAYKFNDDFESYFLLMRHPSTGYLIHLIPEYYFDIVSNPASTGNC